MTPEQAQELLDAATPRPWHIITSRDVFSAVVSDRGPICMDVEQDEDAELIATAPDITRAYIEAAAREQRVRKLIYASDDGTEHEHNGHPAHEGEAECPGCWAADILRALDGAE